MRVKNQVMPELEMRFEGFYVLNKHGMGQKNVIKLAAYQKALGNFENKPVSMVVDYKYVFNGFSSIKDGLCEQLELSISEHMELGWKASGSIDIP